MALYDECFEVWADSPAVESLEIGIETSTLDKEEDSVDIREKEAQDSVQSSSSQSSSSQSYQQESENQEIQPSPGSEAVIKDMGKARRELLKNIKDKKDSKLIKRHSVDAQLLDAAKEEIALKKRALEMMESADRTHAETMQSFLQSMNTMAASIWNEFTMLQGLLQQPRLSPNNQPSWKLLNKFIPNMNRPFQEEIQMKKETKVVLQEEPY